MATETLATTNPVTAARAARLGDLLARLTWRRFDGVGGVWTESLLIQMVDDAPEHYAGKAGRARLTRDLKAAGTVSNATRSISWRFRSRAQPTIIVSVDRALDAKADADLDALDRETFPEDYAEVA